MDSLEPADIEYFLFDVIGRTFDDLATAGCITLESTAAPAPVTTAKGCVTFGPAVCWCLEGGPCGEGYVPLGRCC